MAIKKKKLTPAQRVELFRKRAAKVAEGRMASAVGLPVPKKTPKKATNRVVQVERSREAMMNTEASLVADGNAKTKGGGTAVTVAPWIDQMCTKIEYAVRRGEFGRVAELVKEIEIKGLDYDPELARQVRIDDFLAEFFEPMLAGALSAVGLITFRQLLSLRRDELMALPGIGPTRTELLVAFCRTRFEWHDGRLAMGPRDGYREPDRRLSEAERRALVNRSFVE